MDKIEGFYKKELLVGTYLDPFHDYQEKDVVIEIRQDEVTGVTCHIIPSSYRNPGKPDIASILEKSKRADCPFCPENFEKTTPRFTSDVAKEGRLRKGKAFLFPNAFPHDRFNCVVRLSDQHFISLKELTAESTQDGILVCLDYFQRMKELHPAARFCSINWNYMPPAGGSLVHPHLQTVVSKRPSRYAQTVLAAAQGYKASTGNNLWKDLTAYEKEKAERFVASTGNIEWMTAFAPKGMAGEVWFVFSGKRSIFELDSEDVHDLVMGFSRIFNYFDEKNIIGFNMSLFATLDEEDNFRVQGKLIPRFVILPSEASDVNYFDKLHNEIICPVIPEIMCRELKTLF